MSQAQENERPNIYKSPASDFLMIHIQNEFWLDKPDSVDKRGYSPSFGLYVNKDFGINSSHFSASIGLGISSSNVFFWHDQSLYFKDTSEQLLFLDTVRTHEKYKYSTAWIEVPIEFRYFGNLTNRNKGFKAAFGMKVANLLGARTKEVYSENGIEYKEKFYSKRFAEKWRLTPYMRLGWGNFSVMASYQLTSVFSLDAGPTVFPFSVGLCISGL